MPQIIEERLKAFETISLKQGNHAPPPPDCQCPEGCAVEIGGWLAGMPWGDDGDWICPVIRLSLIRYNDSLATDAERDEWIKPLVPRLIGTRDDSKIAPRAFISADYAVRVFAPIALEAAGRKEDADKLRALDPIVDTTSAKRAEAAARWVADLAQRAAESAQRPAESAEAAVASAERVADLAADLAERLRNVNLARREMIEKMLAV